MDAKIPKVAVLLTLIAILISPALLFFPKQQNVPIGDWGIIESTFRQLYEPEAKTGQFEGKTIDVPVLALDDSIQVLGEENNSNKRIEVNLGNQRVYAYEGDNKVYEFVVSTGKWAATPKGTFTIATKVKVQKMSGGSKANGTYYYLPNVPWIMFFGNSQIPWSRGFSFHGTYWHNNFGTPMSHGCINMTIPDAETLYNWAPQGTKVIIY